MDIRHLAPAGSEWRAVFDDETLSRVVAWAVVGDGDEQQFVGVIVDPNDPSRLVAAPDSHTPEGASFSRYGFREGDG
jgi:hypothetical protein